MPRKVIVSPYDYLNLRTDINDMTLEIYNLLTSLQTIGQELKSEALRTMTTGVMQSLASVTLTAGKWLVWGGFSLNQSSNSGETLDYISALITSTPDSYTTQVQIADEPFSIMVRMVGGQDAAGTVTPRVFTGPATVTLRGLSSFTTSANTLEAGIYAAKIGI